MKGTLILKRWKKMTMGAIGVLAKSKSNKFLLDKMTNFQKTIQKNKKKTGITMKIPVLNPLK